MKRGTIIRETLTLQRDLLNGLKISHVDGWARNSEVRQLLLQHLMFGGIRWLKSSGKPLSPTLNQGFAILYWTEIINIAISQGGPIETSSWAPLPEPFKFDEPDDSDHYNVGFFAQSLNPFWQHIQPTFASGVAWPHFLDQYRSIEPPEWYGLESETNQWTTIPDFTVSLQWL
jgi:hypothetical protein